MRAYELTEGKNTPSIVVDVQPEYTGLMDGNKLSWIDDLMQFLNKQRGPILMFVNAEDQRMTSDSVADVKLYWEDSGFDPSNWSRVEIVDKGYGYFRVWMDNGMSDAAIIKTIREMYKQKVTSSRDLFPDEDKETNSEQREENLYILTMLEFLDLSHGEFDEDIILWEPLTVKWTSVAQLKRFSGAYIMGGARNECLAEVELLMNAFNIKYKRINEFIYG